MSKSNSKYIISDKEILEQIKNGDPMNTMEVLYAREFPKIRSYILKNSGNEEDARDIFQEVIMRLFTHIKLGKFNEDYELAGFMFTVGRNAWRKQAGKAVHTSDLDIADATGQHSEDLYDTIFDVERKNVVEELLNSVGENCKQILKMVLFDNLPLKKVAKILGYATETTAKTRHYKCKQRLIKKVKGSAQLSELLRSIR